MKYILKIPFFFLIIIYGCQSKNDNYTPAEPSTYLKQSGGGTNDPDNNNGSFIDSTELKFQAIKDGNAIPASWAGDSTLPRSSNGVRMTEFIVRAKFTRTDSIPRGKESVINITAVNNDLGFSTTITLTQDNRDALRQEYLDYYISPFDVPLFSIFDHTDPGIHIHPYPRLVDKSNHDVENWHSWWIVNDLLDKVDAVESYSTSLYFIQATSGYRCPVGNSNTIPPGAHNSKHMYGKAFDWNQGNAGLQDPDKYIENYKVWVAAGMTSTQENILYDQDGNRIISVPPATLPANLTVRINGTDENRTVTSYSHGHAGWN